MKRLIFAIFGLYSFSFALPLSVSYDPFMKAQKIIKYSKKPNVYTIKRVRLVVNGILNNKAFINGKFYKVGERIAGYRIEKISKNYIVLRKNGIVKIVPLQKKKILRIRQP